MIRLSNREEKRYEYCLNETEWIEKGSPILALIGYNPVEATKKGFEVVEVRSHRTGKWEKYIRPRKPLFTKASEVTDEEVQYTWFPYLVDNNINIFGGEAGTGKTWCLCAIMSAISKTNTEPVPGMPGVPKRHGKVLYCGGEDANSTVKKRLEQLGANLDNIYLVDTSFPIRGDDMLLEEMIEEVEPVLVIFDALLSYFPRGYKNNDYQDCRFIMDYLRDLARESKTCIVAVVHPPKKEDYKLQNRFTGSGGFVDSTRSAIYIGYHPSNESQRVGFQVKANNVHGEPFIFELDEELGYLWKGTDRDITAVDIEKAVAKHKGGKNLDYLEHLLVETMKAHPTGINNKTAKEILEAISRVLNHDVSTQVFGQALNSEIFQRAMKQQGIVIRKGSRGQNKQRYHINYAESVLDNIS